MSGADDRDLPHGYYDELEELIGDPEIEGSERWTVGDVARFIADPGPWADILKVRAVKERETARLIKREEEWLYVRDEARKRHERKTRPTADPPSLVSLTKLLDEPDEEVPYLVDGVWPKQGRIVLAAQNKTGKSTLVGNLIRSLVDGEAFLGRFPVERVERVVLVDNELSRRMVRQWFREQGILKTDAVEVVCLKGALSSFNILDPEVRQEWAERIGPADVLIFDCLRPVLDSLGLSEDKDAGRFLVAFDELLAASSIPDAGVVHHMGHSNERSGGGSRIEDWPDAKWKLVKEDADDPDSPRYFAAFGRDVEQGEVRLHFNPDNRHLTIDGGSRRQATVSRIEDNVLLYIAGNPGVSKGKIESAVQGDDKEIRKILDRLVGEQRVVRRPGPNRSQQHFLPEDAENVENP
jgi:hypothetical protein